MENDKSDDISRNKDNKKMFFVFFFGYLYGYLSGLKAKDKKNKDKKDNSMFL